MNPARTARRMGLPSQQPSLRMTEPALKTLSDIVTDAHARIQASRTDINPVVGLRRGMRESGVPADALTIDCLQSGRRIVLILHDQHPDAVLYQFARMDQDADADFQRLALSEMTAELLTEWIGEYFAAPADPLH